MTTPHDMDDKPPHVDGICKTNPQWWEYLQRPPNMTPQERRHYEKQLAIREADNELAARICWKCPAIKACRTALQWELDHGGFPTGVWAGLNIGGEDGQDTRNIAKVKRLSDKFPVH